MHAWPFQVPPPGLRHLLKAWGAQFQEGHQADRSVSGNQVCAVQNPVVGRPSRLCSVPAVVAYLLKVTRGYCSVARQRGTAVL